MSHHESTDSTDRTPDAGDEHDDVLYATQGNPVTDDAHIEEVRDAPARGGYTESESAEEKAEREEREGGDAGA